MVTRDVVPDRVREVETLFPLHRFPVPVLSTDPAVSRAARHNNTQTPIPDVQDGILNRRVIAQVGPGPLLCRRQPGHVEAQGLHVAQHDDGHGAGFVGVFARGALGELGVFGHDVGGEEFEDGFGVAVENGRVSMGDWMSEGGREVDGLVVYFVVLKEPDGAEAVAGDESEGHPVGGIDALDVVGWYGCCGCGCVCDYG